MLCVVFMRRWWLWNESAAAGDVNQIKCHAAVQCEKQIIPAHWLDIARQTASECYTRIFNKSTPHARGCMLFCEGVHFFCLVAQERYSDQHRGTRKARRCGMYVTMIRMMMPQQQLQKLLGHKVHRTPNSLSLSFSFALAAWQHFRNMLRTPLHTLQPDLPDDSTAAQYHSTNAQKQVHKVSWSGGWFGGGSMLMGPNVMGAQLGRESRQSTPVKGVLLQLRRSSRRGSVLHKHIHWSERDCVLLAYSS